MCHLVYSQLNKNNGPSNLQELSHVPNYYILYINVLTLKRVTKKDTRD